MKLVMIGLLSSLVLCAVGSIVVAAPGQVNRPGEISPANVWVQNRRPDEAIPVNIVGAGQPLRVQIASALPDGTITTRSARQQWEYMQVRVAANQDAGAILNAAGTAEWEVTGVTSATNNTMVVLLKRPR